MVTLARACKFALGLYVGVASSRSLSELPNNDKQPLSKPQAPHTPTAYTLAVLAAAVAYRTFEFVTYCQTRNIRRFTADARFVTPCDVPGSHHCVPLYPERYISRRNRLLPSSAFS
jgi:hypothetical protein